MSDPEGTVCTGRFARCKVLLWQAPMCSERLPRGHRVLMLRSAPESWSNLACVAVFRCDVAAQLTQLSRIESVCFGKV